LQRRNGLFVGYAAKDIPSADAIAASPIMVLCGQLVSGFLMSMHFVAVWRRAAAESPRWEIAVHPTACSVLRISPNAELNALELRAFFRAICAGAHLARSFHRRGLYALSSSG